MVNYAVIMAMYIHMYISAWEALLGSICGRAMITYDCTDIFTNYAYVHTGLFVFERYSGYVSNDIKCGNKHKIQQIASWLPIHTSLGHKHAYLS